MKEGAVAVKLVTSDDVGHWNHQASAVLRETQDRPLWVRSPEPAHTLGPPDPVLRVEFLPDAVHPGPDLPCTFTTAPGVHTEPGPTVDILFWASGPLGGYRGPHNRSSRCFSECQHFWTSA